MEEVKEKWMDYLSGAITLAEWEKWKLSVAGDAETERELYSLERLWKAMDGLPPAPEPSVAMHDRFYSTLAEMKRSSRPATGTTSFNFMELFTWRRLALGLSIFLMGGIMGYFASPSGEYKMEISALSTEMKDMKAMMMLALLEKPAAQDRLRAVSLSTELPEADTQVIDALVQTLNHDPNVNVRLVTVEALARFGKYPEVREALIQSIGKQTSPMVQIAMANAMVALNEKNAVDALQELLQKEDLNETVRLKVKESIAVLI